MDDNFKIISQKTAFSCQYYKVREDEFIYPNGKNGRFWVVERPTAAIAVALTEQNETYLVGQYRYAPGVYSWEFPMGSSEENEQPIDGAKRELAEETGVTAKKWEIISEFKVAPGLTSQKGVICLAREVSEGKASPSETEDLEVKRIKLEEVYEMVKRGEITDGLTLTTLLLLKMQVDGRK